MKKKTYQKPQILATLDSRDLKPSYRAAFTRPVTKTATAAMA